MNNKELESYLSPRDDYQRENFDKFLKKVGFSYDVPSIHIAGTNGKGSTASYIASIYQKAGYKVGLFTSPFFYNINEMIKINGKEITDNDIDHYIRANKKQIDKFNISSFELETFIALSFFKDNKVDIAVIECGMGGMVDATNIFIPVLSIITTVSLEHTMFLGSSIYEIASHKAGIIKEEVPCLIGELDEEAEKTVSDYARSMNAPLTKVGPTFNISYKEEGIVFSYHYYQDIYLSSKADYACYDASIAIEAVKILENKFKVSEEDIRNGLKEVHMINRMEEISSSPLIIIDGAHNHEAIDKLEKAITNKYYDKKIHILFACFRDKNISSMLPKLSLLTSDIVLTTFDHPRARGEEDYFLFGEDYKFNPNYLSALKGLIETYPEDLILVTGSLAFASVVRKDILEGKIK